MCTECMMPLHHTSVPPALPSGPRYVRQEGGMGGRVKEREGGRAGGSGGREGGRERGSVRGEGGMSLASHLGQNSDMEAVQETGWRQ
jgi:hypothetical protein